MDRLLELSEGCYLEFLLRAIGQVISLMVKIDAHTNTTTRGRFVWMAMHSSSFYLGSQVVGVEAAAGQNESKGEKPNLQNHVDEKPFGPWMIKGISDGFVNWEGIAARIKGKKDVKLAGDKSNRKENNGVTVEGTRDRSFEQGNCKGIVNGIEWSQNQYIPTTLSQTVVEVMDAKSNQNKGGTGHPCFQKIIAEYRNEFRPNILCLFKTQISALRVDGIFGKLGYQNSCRIEANGFAGGIWVL
ncbi:hypothetical protein GOBAR_AA25368 [Gossypium barbadense]|uniref:Uncharacterized protein n=1 Tax=Gossypium barbadense TaxID=3634 RepID=A0A2P5WW41_GOSBA|nr:hypothetical protein GOBAR_AA25368 [Gossypium barbadense]